MGERDLRRRCRRMLRDLGIRPPLDVEELCRRVGDQRGREIKLLAYPLTVPGPFGVWIASQKADYVFYQEATSKIHQRHIILHELGHIIAGHESDGAGVDTLGQAIPRNQDGGLRQFPDLGPEAVRKAQLRTCYDTASEREAESVATIILEWASVIDRMAPMASSTTATRRMESALGDHLGWL
ncbi:MAG TPA: hypothetical protein VM677_01405 [Actinokineospora sp.]|nr:hypothetical protein [Actinokineospora sp.]